MAQRKPARKRSVGPKTNSRWGFQGKTFWDWLQLLIVPFVLFGLGVAFAWQQDSRQEATDQNAALQAYLDQMSTLLIEEDLRNPDRPNEDRTLARARTLTALEGMDPSRRTQVLRFLTEAELVQRVEGEGPVISLADANLQGVHLAGAHLQGAFLFRANLSDAYLVGADLTDADLVGANLRNAQLGFGADPNTGAFLRQADLTLADLSDTDLSGVWLNNANLKMASLGDADLTKANLTDANVTQEQLDRARSLEGATMPDGSKQP